MPARVCVLLFSTALLCGQSKDAEVAVHLQKGADAQGRRDLQAAVEEFRKAIALDPSRAEAQARLGMVYQDLGKLPEAASAFEQALKLNPEIPGVGLLLAFTYQGMGKSREAIPYLERALESEAELPVRL